MTATSDRDHTITLHIRTAAVTGAGTLPVEGVVELENGATRPFTGWIGLVNELERAVSDRAPVLDGDR